MLYRRWMINKWQERKAQILLPAVLLAPIFVLVIYLLFETAKVSMTKVRQQFALDNAAYSQVSSASTYLNALALANGPLPYRVFLELGPEGSGAFEPLPAVQGRSNEKVTIFDLFYKGGGFPSVGPADNGINPPPAPESTDWQVKYYKGEEVDEQFPRSEWEKENPKEPASDKYVPVMSKSLTDSHFFMTRGGQAVQAIVFYLETFARVGSVYRSQDYIYRELSKNAIMFREAYFLNVNDCKRSECARQSAAQLRPYLESLKTKPFELSKIHFYASEATGGSNAGSYPIPFEAEEVLGGQKLFQFAYLDPSSRSKLKSLSYGISLKQPFKLPRNHFNINLEQKYKPYVRTRVVLSCPRNSNNCVWPNPLPKYSVTLDP